MSATRIYLDYQATTPCAPSVIEAMSPFWADEFGNPHSSDHAFGWRAEDAVSAARQNIAELIGATAEEVVFTSGATESNNQALLGLLHHIPGAGRNVVVSAIEHKCVLESARQLERVGYSVRKAPVRRSGHFDLAALADLIDPATALVSVMLVNNEIGTVQPVAEVARLCKEVGAILHCDAAQAPTGMIVNVGALGVDLMSISSHKVYGPKGVGALFVSHEVRHRLRPLIHGGGQEGGLRSGTLPTPICVGFGEAARLLRRSIDDDISLLSVARKAFLEKLVVNIPDLAVNGDEPRHPGHLNLWIPRAEADLLITNLQPLLALSTGSACSSGIPEPSHVLRAIGLDADRAGECIRIGFGRGVDEQQARDAADLLTDAVFALRQGGNLPRRFENAGPSC
jgi:cysteine desulfurase